MVNRWSDTSSRRRCTVSTENQEQCDMLHFGHLVKTFRTWKLWPGQAQRLVSILESRSIKATSASFKRTRAPKYCEYDNGLLSTIDHHHCGWTEEFYRLIDSDLDDKVHEVIEASVPHLKSQQQKLRPTKILVSRYES